MWTDKGAEPGLWQPARRFLVVGDGPGRLGPLGRGSRGGWAPVGVSVLEGWGPRPRAGWCRWVPVGSAGLCPASRGPGLPAPENFV